MSTRYGYGYSTINANNLSNRIRSLFSRSRRYFVDVTGDEMYGNLNMTNNSIKNVKNNTSEMDDKDVVNYKTLKDTVTNLQNTITQLQNKINNSITQLQSNLNKMKPVSTIVNFESPNSFIFINDNLSNFSSVHLTIQIGGDEYTTIVINSLDGDYYFQKILNAEKIAFSKISFKVKDHRSFELTLNRIIILNLKENKFDLEDTTYSYKITKILLF